MRVAYDQQQISTGTEVGLPSWGLCRSIPVVGQADESGFSVPRLTRTSRATLGRPFGVGTLPIPSLSQRNSLDVSALGAGVMDVLPICHPRCNFGSRRDLKGLRDQSLDFRFRRRGHRLQNIAQAPHNHQSVLSSALVLVGFDANENGLTNAQIFFASGSKTNDRPQR